MSRYDSQGRLALEDRIRKAVLPEQGRIPMFTYTDPGVYELEIERIFGRSWLFVGHVSEVPRAGSFVTRTMGEESVIVGRGDDSVVRVFLNACRHRGMRLACEDFGEVNNWRCPYHGFTYGSKGDFLGTFMGAPFEKVAYPEGLDRGALHLVEARCEVYQGLIFATWAKRGPSLDEFLGAAKWYLDLIVGRAEMEVVGHPERWMVPTGWRLPAENFASDAYHTATAHSFLQRLQMVKGADFGRSGYHVDVGGGHGLGVGVHSDEQSYFPTELAEEYARNLDAGQLHTLSRLKNLHGNVFPNFTFLIPNFIEVEGKLVSGAMLRVWQPAGPNRTQVWSWHFVEKNAPEWWKKLGKRMYTQTFSSSGMFDQDDTENWEMQTRVSDAALYRDEELDLHYGMGMTMPTLGKDEFPGPGDVYDGKFSESAARTYYRVWRDRLLEGTR
ncbi:Rieske 2Fe-2S domain-containing protein [Amycolatopsis rhabdoformis]|uniref:Rieske 2Fe-2S domain-containing protein n=1 Tax=Amycolatopsis rhabdoformis TaxID=1448059 RepID=A0ABZ1IGF7_9PSEU|nr:Rieske 2Fe-2S domain-containing protein [Amycolatopsis rhabdoformis]WSE33555.1 Rieske 2Fe-2S domain-containing protein [Amycolatopsis rhabdoformis]